MTAPWTLDHFDGVDMSDGEAHDREMYGVDDWGFTWRPGRPLPRDHPMHGGDSSSDVDGDDRAQSSSHSMHGGDSSSDVNVDEDVDDPEQYVSPWHQVHRTIVMAVIVAWYAYWIADWMLAKLS